MGGKLFFIYLACLKMSFFSLWIIIQQSVYLFQFIIIIIIILAMSLRKVKDLYFLLKGHRYSEPSLVRCFIDTENPTRWKTLSKWWPGCSHDISCHNSENLPQGNGNKLTLEEPYLKPSRWCWSDQQWPISNHWADSAVSARSPLALSIKALTSCFPGGELAFG